MKLQFLKKHQTASNWLYFLNSVSCNQTVAKRVTFKHQNNTHLTLCNTKRGFLLRQNKKVYKDSIQKFQETDNVMILQICYQKQQKDVQIIPPADIINVVGISNKIVFLSSVPSDQSDVESEGICDSSGWLSTVSSVGVSDLTTLLSLNFSRRGLPISS